MLTSLLSAAYGILKSSPQLSKPRFRAHWLEQYLVLNCTGVADCGSPAAEARRFAGLCERAERNFSIANNTTGPPEL